MFYRRSKIAWVESPRAESITETLFEGSRHPRRATTCGDLGFERAR
jgi:hypothetical protein